MELEGELLVFMSDAIEVYAASMAVQARLMDRPGAALAYPISMVRLGASQREGFERELAFEAVWLHVEVSIRSGVAATANAGS